MLKKLTKLVINNFGLKLMALLFAVVLWLVVVNIDDPTQTKTFTTSVSIENEDAITSLGKYYEVVDGINTVSFKVSAKRSVLRVLSNTDFKAVADMSKTEDMTRVPIEITATRYISSITFTSKTQYLDINVEDLQTKQLVISPGYTGTPADNCAVGNVSVDSSNVLKVSGPASVVSKIESAKAVINVDGMSTSITDSVVPTLYDSDGNVVDTTRLTLNMDTVNVSAEILDIKYVEISASITGTPQSGYVNTSVTYSPQTVAIKGGATALNSVNSIEIPEGIIDIDGATGTQTQTVDISSYLPDGVTLANSDDKKVEVTVTIEQITTKTFSVPAQNITITNIPTGYDAAFKSDPVNVSIRGLESDLNKLSADDLKGVVDATGLGEGDHSVAIDLELDDSLYTTDGTQTTILTITVKNTDSGTTDNSGDNTDTDKANTGTDEDSSDSSGKNTSGDTNTTGKTSTTGKTNNE